MNNFTHLIQKSNTLPVDIPMQAGCASTPVFSLIRRNGNCPLKLDSTRLYAQGNNAWVGCSQTAHDYGQPFISLKPSNHCYAV
jgi:hypothetical protein